MKHTEWLRLKAEGENICSILRQQGYQCIKQTRRLSWKITTEGLCYVLTWLPAPVGNWSILPNDHSPAHKQLVLVVKNALTQRKKAPTSQPISSEDLHRPWTIVRILPNAQCHIVARFFNRQDAHDHERVLQRFIAGANFEIVFDPPEEKELDDQA
ncbi:hypothetical protein [Coleofasciculus sp. G2-EDA-02]|uniref:hypothetical protein n=1 Tax=Coleofasciculus sp. G2-EDA-02 TaxID=3069529 RepID=UPI00330151DE